MKPTLADLERAIEAAETAPSAEARSKWLVATDFATHAELAATANGAYMLGYAYYQLESSASASLKATQFLQRALEIDSEHVYARLYLGHIAFDERRFGDALNWIGGLKPLTFMGLGQAWRDLKNQELRICCLLHLGSTKDMVREFEEYLKLAAQMDPDDATVVYELPKMLQAQYTNGADEASQENPSK